MDGSIITGLFDKAEEKQELQVWVCGQCNNSTFSLFNNGTVACGHCNQIICDTCVDTEGWRKVLPPSPEIATRDTAGVVKVDAMGSAEFAQRAVFRDIEKWLKGGELEFVVGGNEKGGTRAWFNVVTAKDRESIAENIRGYVEHVEKMEIADDAQETLDI